MVMPVKIYFEILLADNFTVKSASEKDKPINSATHKVLYLDYKTLKADGHVDVLPEFSMPVFQLGNNKAIKKIAYNDSTRTIIVFYIDQSFGFHTKQIDKQINNINQIEFCKNLEEVLNKILNLPN